MKTPHSIEPLEARIAPAGLVTYLDADGDLVKVTASAGPLDITDLALPSGDPAVRSPLYKLTLTEAGFAGANITFTVTKKAGGDGFADVGFINAGTNDLGNVTVKGDLGQIHAGNGNDTDGPALKTLSVRSMGLYGRASQGGGGDLLSEIDGSVVALKVTRDIAGAYFYLAAGDIGSVTIGGSLIGSGNIPGSGAIYAGGDLGPVVVKGDVIGGTQNSSGSLGAGHAVKSVTIGGSVFGGLGTDSGSIFSGFVAADTMGPVKIGRDLHGGGGTGSGRVKGFGGMTSFTVGGSVLGGGGESSGSLEAGDVGKISIRGSVIAGTRSDTGLISVHDVPGGISIGGSLDGGFFNVDAGQTIQRVGALHVFDTGPIKIGGDIIGARLTGDGNLISSGRILGSSFASVTIGGSFIAGHESGTGNLTETGQIQANSIGSVKIKGGIVGNETQTAIIAAIGPTTVDPKLGSLTVGGRVERALIFVGASAEARTGAVKVGGDWIASSLQAGVLANNGFYGDGDDTLEAANSRIASVTIGGIVIGTTAAGDHYGFVAHEIGAFKVSGRTIPRTAGTVEAPVNLAYATGDVTLREI